MAKKTKKKGRSFRYYLSFTVLYVLILGGIFFTVFSPDKAECANSITCINDLSGEYENDVQDAQFLGKSLPVPTQEAGIQKAVLGDETNQNKRIYVDLTNQTLFAYDGKIKVFEFPISSGKFGWTPTGDFKIWYKVKYTRMSGGSKEDGTYYNLPNVPFTMFFYNEEIPKSRGYGIHGAYWHDNFGVPMSHGCINLRPEDAEMLFYWADPVTEKNSLSVPNTMISTPITIYGKYQG